MDLGHSCVQEKMTNSTERTLINLKENGMKSPISWSKTSKESGHPIFRGISALDGGVLKRKSGRCTIHFTAESSIAELLFRTIHSANQLSIHGAVASWCEKLAQLIPGQTHKANDQALQTIHDVDDGFGKGTCRENTLPRDDTKSEIKRSCQNWSGTSSQEHQVS